MGFFNNNKTRSWQNDKGLHLHLHVHVPLLVQRCNGTAAGLGYLEVMEICPCKSPLWAVDYSVRIVGPYWGE
jgi:hypothetical protein